MDEVHVWVLYSYFVILTGVVGEYNMTNLIKYIFEEIEFSYIFFDFNPNHPKSLKINWRILMIL